MDLQTVTEYAQEKGISRQAVYSLIKKGKIVAIEQDGVKMIQIEPTNTKEPTSNCKEIVKPYKALVKQLKREIKQLNKQIVKIETTKDKNYERLEHLFNLAITNKKQIAEVIDTEVLKPKKKNKKKNRKA